MTGMPGAGKSTVARLVASGLPRSAHLDGDEVNQMIVGGGVWALGEPADEAARQVELGNRNLCTLAENFADAGFTPVIDSVIPTRQQLDFFRNHLAPRPVLFVVLAPGAKVCRDREMNRDLDQRWDFAGYEALNPKCSTSSVMSAGGSTQPPSALSRRPRRSSTTPATGRCSGSSPGAPRHGRRAAAIPTHRSSLLAQEAIACSWLRRTVPACALANSNAPKCRNGSVGRRGARSSSPSP